MEITIKPKGTTTIVAKTEIALSDQGMIWTKDGEIWMTQKAYDSYISRREKT